MTGNETIYILCPPNHMTGGPEALHQLCARLTKIGRSARMVYTNGSDHSLMPSPDGETTMVFREYENAVHPQYRAYATESSDYIIDNENAIVVFPEIWPHLIPLFKKATKAYWWLSFDYGMGHLMPLGGVPFLLANDCKMLSQSSYATAQLSILGFSDVLRISDFTTLANNVTPQPIQQRRDLVLFNNKAEAFGRQLATMSPQYEFKILSKMSPTEVHQNMAQAKLYVDFGPHAGKDRMPREAALLGCCVITGRNGSANNFEDLPIPAKYKFGNHPQRTHEISRAIDDVIQNFPERFEDFGIYRRSIAVEETKFELEVFSVFGQV
ncbi:hypothetical protein [Rhizobium sp. No.120]